MATKKHVWKFDLEEYPADLAKGSYQLTFKTWFSNNNVPLKQSRTLTCDIPLVVGGSGGGSEAFDTIE